MAYADDAKYFRLAMQQVELIRYNWDTWGLDKKISEIDTVITYIEAIKNKDLREAAYKILFMLQRTYSDFVMIYSATQTQRRIKEEEGG